MKIGILQTGRIPPELEGKHEDYDAMFRTLLGNEHFSYQTWAVLDNELPTAVDESDGWLITGSRFGAYEDHAWIPPLEEHIRAVYAAGIPLVGICFGHQIMAQALGGKVVKYDGGWSVGHVDYQVDNVPQAVGIHAFHQDQVIELPDEANSFGSTAFCQYAFIRYKQPALSLQPHPEFNNAYVRDLLHARGEILPPEILKAGLESVGNPLATEWIATELINFFLEHNQSDHNQDQASAAT